MEQSSGGCGGGGAGRSAGPSSSSSALVAGNAQRYKEQVAAVAAVVEGLPAGLVRHDVAKCLRRLNAILDHEESFPSTVVARLEQFLPARSSAQAGGVEDAASAGSVNENGQIPDAALLFALVHQFLVEKRGLVNTDRGRRLPAEWIASPDGSGVFCVQYHPDAPFPRPDVTATRGFCGVELRGVVVGQHLCLSLVWTPLPGSPSESQASHDFELDVRDFVNGAFVPAEAQQRLWLTLRRQSAPPLRDVSKAATDRGAKAGACEHDGRKRGRLEQATPGSTADLFRGGQETGEPADLHTSYYPGLLVGPDHPMFRGGGAEGGPGERGGGLVPRFDPIGPANPDLGTPARLERPNPANDEFMPPALEDEHQLQGIGVLNPQGSRDRLSRRSGDNRDSAPQ